MLKYAWVLVVFFSSVAFAQETTNQDLLNWARQMNKKALMKHKAPVITLNIQCENDSYFVVHNEKLEQHYLMGRDYKIKVSKTQRGNIKLVGKTWFSNSYGYPFWFDGPISDGEFKIRGKFRNNAACHGQGYVRNEEFLLND